ncbi:MAG: hypothetical protein EOO68_40695, partial [Moraxellaceae bacterium]
MPTSTAVKGEGVVFLLANGYQYEYPASKVYTDTNIKNGSKSNNFTLVATVVLRKEDLADFSKFVVT